MRSCLHLARAALHDNLDNRLHREKDAGLYNLSRAILGLCDELECLDRDLSDLSRRMFRVEGKLGITPDIAPARK